MRKKLMFLAAFGVLAAAPVAQADTTLGTTTQPSDTTAGGCTGGVVVAQATDTSALPYLVPAEAAA